MQKIKVNVLVADRKFRKLIFSVKPKEKEELVEKKRSVMVRRNIWLLWSLFYFLFTSLYGREAYSREWHFFFASKIGFISLKIYTPSNRGFPSSCENTKEVGMEH